ncbi:MAG TPA: hypothetical protein VJC10_00170 [Patescibacteria group bacterium]|nr:hypothetical protein [Patescibacteria group bacterium]
MEGSIVSPDSLSTPRKPNASPEELHIKTLAQAVRTSFDALKPNVPESDQSNEFWDHVDFLRRPDMTYGDVQVVSSGTDELGTRRSFKRTIVDQSGKQVGEWTKRGFVTPDGTLTQVTEEDYDPALKRGEEVRIGFNKDYKIINIRNTVKENYVVTRDCELEYQYDDDGNLHSTTYIDNLAKPIMPSTTTVNPGTEQASPQSKAGALGGVRTAIARLLRKS